MKNIESILLINYVSFTKENYNHIQTVDNEFQHIYIQFENIFVSKLIFNETLILNST